jgi:FkbM family methyltransferase
MNMRARFLYRAWKARLRDQRLEIAVARACIRPGELVIDAGANKGAYLYWLRKAVGPAGKVVAYEPQPALARYLREICDRSGWINIQINEIALSNSSGKATLHVPGSGVSPGASLEASALDHESGSQFECVVDTLDHQLENQAPLRFLKVDVEGHELALFQGGIETLRRDRPVILFECEARHLTRHSMEDVFSFLQGLGYEGYLLKKRSLLPVSDFDVSVHQPSDSPRFWDKEDYFNNFVFVPSGSGAGGLARWIESSTGGK